MKNINLKIELLKLDEVNKNKRLYPKKVGEQLVKHFEENKDKHLLAGMIGMPDDFGMLSLDKMTHIVKRMEIIDGSLMVEIDVLSTPSGDILNKMIEDNKVEFAVAGFSKESHEENGILIIDDFELHSVNAIEAGTKA